MRFTVLVENTTTSPALRARHGLSLYLETGRHRLLFDMGPDALFAENAEKLGVDLEAVDTAVISHGHYDHGGGLDVFLRRNGGARVYLHRDAFGRHAIRVFGFPKSIGLKPGLKSSPRLVFTGDQLAIDDELTLFADVTGDRLCPGSNRALLRRGEGGYVPDDFRHEQSLLIRTGEKTVLVAGCAHRGILNILDAAEAHGGHVDVVLSGLHLFNPASGRAEPDELVDSLARALSGRDTVIYTGHCTGERQFDRLRTALGDQLRYMSTGDSFTL